MLLMEKTAKNTGGVAASRKTRHFMTYKKAFRCAALQKTAMRGVEVF